MKRFLFIIVGIVLSCSVWAQGYAQVEETTESSPLKLNVYWERYKKEDGVTTKVAMQRTLMRLNRECPGEKKLTEDDIRLVLAGKTEPLLERCGAGERVLTQHAQVLRDRIVAILKDEEESAEFEEQLEEEVRNETLFGDSRTDNTAYDLMVDLNILDVIWFGDKAQYVRAPWGGSLLSFRKGEYDPSDPGSLNRDGNANNNGNGNGSGGNGNRNGNSNTNGNSWGNGNRNTNGTNANTNGSGSGGNNGNVNGGLICLPSDAPNLNGSILSDLGRDARDARDTASGSILAGDYVLDDDPRPLEERPYGTVLENSVTDEDDEYAPGDFSNNLEDIENGTETSAVGEGNDRLLCNAFFCIKVSLKKGVATVAVKDNSIRAHYAAILKDLTKLRGYNLELGQTTSGFLDPGMFNIDFAKNLHLEVFINKKPVWNPNKYEYSSAEVAEIRKELREKRKVLLADVQNLCSDPNLQKVGGVKVQDAQEKALACVRRIEAEWESLIAEQKIKARNKNEIDMAPLENEVRQMREFIRTMVSNFRSNDGIRQQALELSKKPVK